LAEILTTHQYQRRQVDVRVQELRFVRRQCARGQIAGRAEFKVSEYQMTQWLIW